MYTHFLTGERGDGVGSVVYVLLSAYQVDRHGDVMSVGHCVNDIVRTVGCVAAEADSFMGGL